ncbi:MAG: hypothetical protein H0V71_12185 [Chloroflexi bacterium]|nr:hypothetical protein [Chloroflexota bacterium]
MDTRVEYTPGRYFGIAFLVKNRSDRTVTITQVWGIDSGRRFVRLVGVKLVPFAPRRCPGSCPVSVAIPFGNKKMRVVRVGATGDAFF